MDSSSTLGIVAIAISLIAIAVSTCLAVLQVRMMRNANYLPVVTELISEFRRKGFYDDLVYVTTKLRSEHDPAVGISGLPGDARTAFLNIAFFYQSCAWLIELRILQREPLLGLMRDRILVVWPVIKPYVDVERTTLPGPILKILERVHDSVAGSGSEE